MKRRRLDYISAAAQLRVAEQRQAQLARRIEWLKDEVIDAGLRAVEKHATSAYNRRDEGQMHRVLAALDCHTWEDWGVDMPDGLCVPDLIKATGLRGDDVREGIKQLREMCARGYKYRLEETVLSGIDRFMLVRHEDRA